MEPPRRSLGTVAAGMVLTGVSNRWWQNGKAASWRLPTMGFLRAPVIARPVAGVVRARPQGTAIELPMALQRGARDTAPGCSRPVCLKSGGTPWALAGAPVIGTCPLCRGIPVVAEIGS